MDCERCDNYEVALDAPCYVCTYVGKCPYENNGSKEKVEEYDDTDEDLLW